MSNTSQPNSRKVTIFRTSSFILDAQMEKAPEFVSNSTKSIGPYFILNSKQVGSGLTEEETRILMPLIIDSEYGERDFRDKTRAFYDRLRTNVPFPMGVTLETGLTGDNDKPLCNDSGKLNLPIEPMEYVRYKHALRHPQVAKTKGSAIGNSMFWFYISDPVAERAILQVVADKRDDAQGIYLGLKKDKMKVDMYLTLLLLDPRAYATDADRAVALRDKAEGNPEEFLKVHKTDNFEQRYLVQTLINTGVFKQINGHLISDAETSKIIGNNIDEAIVTIQSKEFETTLPIWKQKMQDALKKPFVRRTAATT